MKQTTSSADRNMTVIRDQLLDIVPASARDLLEISSGTGQHGALCSAALPRLRWWPTEFDAGRLASISAYVADAPSSNLMPPQLVDVMEDAWETGTRPEHVDIILNINMIHIAPWAACAGLLRGAGRKLNQGGLLVLYGPFRQRDIETADSNEAFDVWLKNQHPAYGVRLLEDVAEEAAQSGLAITRVIPVPANNLIVVFRSG